MQLPFEWQGQYEKCSICNDVRDGILYNELVDVDSTREPT